MDRECGLHGCPRRHSHRYTLTAADPGGERKFYRIVGYSTTAEDSDGDGLSDTFETTLGTIVNDADSDDDGFNDGMEFAVGTDPNDPNSFPDQAELPIVSFTSDVYFMEEGSTMVTTQNGTTSTAITLDTSTYTGAIGYSIAGYQHGGVWDGPHPSGSCHSTFHWQRDGGRSRAAGR